MIEVQRPSLPPQANPTPRPRTKQHAKASCRRRYPVVSDTTTVADTPAARAPKAFEFISSDSGGKPPANTRKFIRSYVMRGKNTKKRSTVYQVSGPSFQPDQEDGQPGESTPSLPPSSPPSSSSSSSPSGASTVHGQVAPALHRNSRASVLGGHGKRPHFDFPRTCPAPVRTPHDLALVELPEVFKSTTQQLLYTCKLLPVLAKSQPHDNVLPYRLHVYQGNHVPSGVVLRGRWHAVLLVPVALR